MVDMVTLNDVRPSEVRLSPDGATLYSADQDGFLRVYDVRTGNLINSWDVGQSLGGMDISPDGSFLAIVERNLSTTYRVDTATGQSSSYLYATNGYDGLLFDVAILSDGTALFSQNFNGSGWTALKVLNYGTGSYSAGQDVRQSSVLTRNADGNYVLIGEPNSSGGPMDIYRTGAGIVATTGAGGFNWGIQAFSGTLAAQYIYNEGIHIYDAQLHRIVTLTTWTGGDVTDLAFSADGSWLYVLNNDEDEIVKVSTSDWDVDGVIPVGTEVGSWLGQVGASNGSRLIVDPLGRYFSVATDTGLVLVANPDVPEVRGDGGANILQGTLFADHLNGLAGNDVLTGAGGDDVLEGGAGNDVLDGGLGADHMVGGAGNDSYIVDNINDVVVEAAGGGLDTVEASVSYRLPDNVEVLRLVNLTVGADGYGNGSDNLISAETVTGPLPVWGNIRLFGEGGNDQLVGSRFADMLDGGAGDDIMMGGLGDDLYIVDSLKDVVVEAANGGARDHVNTAISYTLSTNVEWLTLTGSGNIRGTGNQLDNIITGNDGHNVLAGQLGDDTLNGMAGDDILIPDTGNNIVDGGEGTDTLLLLGVKSSYNVLEAHGAIYLVGEEGATRMTGVETVRFADGALATADLKANLAAFDGLRYAASYSDLAAAFGTDATAATNHYISTGFAEGRDAKAFDPLDYIAGYSDLISAFGTNAAAGTRHYLTAGRLEGRTDERFSGLDYAASYPTLAAQFGADEEAAARHYILTGRAQGLTDSGFDALQYAASYKDLAALFGTDTDAATRHYLQFGRAEGRSADAFDGLRYVASNADLIVAIGSDDDGAAAHFLRSGFAENRPTSSFDALKYAAANPDVAAAFGSDVEALTEHYSDHGYYEHRPLAPAAAMVELIG
jgi:Ca2+-binding RTX toxin-like protein